jgi:hypothetical protein
VALGTSLGFVEIGVAVGLVLGLILGLALDHGFRARV